LWFDQPGRSHNLLDRPALDELESHLGEAAADSAIRGLVLRSGKPGGFCAGIDLQTIRACRAAAEVEEFLLRGWAVLDRLSALAVPTVAVIHGACLGGGLELALLCRRRVALASAAPLQAGLPQVQLGLVPAWGGITRLPRLIGPEDALDLLVSGRSIGYLRARSLGIVDRLAAEGDPEESPELWDSAPRPQRTSAKETWNNALSRARVQLEEQPGDLPEAQERIFTLVAIDLADGPDAVRREAVRAFAELSMSEETRELIDSFLQRGRRAPGP
jgi:3-hydroxyacyl-CoA dehydrogenase/enoyl-CoA hydratase/3-hydroxybutyryl-CoA epimerase